MLELITDWNPLARGVIALLFAFISTLMIGNKVILKLISMKLGQPVRSKEEVNELYDLHGKKAGTPTMGGVMILATLLIAVLLAGDLMNPYIHVTVFVLLALGALGFKDDYAKISAGNSKGVSSKFKLVWQFGVALIATVVITFTPEIYGYSSDIAANTSLQSLGVKEISGSGIHSYVPTLGEHHPKGLFIPGVNIPIDLGWLAIPFGIIVIIGASNAVNLTDGLDGLASGCTITTCISYTLIAAVAGAGVVGIADTASAELAVLTMAMIGSVAGFLWYNAYPARVFMGDTGSLAIGGAIGVIALATKQELLLVVIGFVFVVEALSVMAQVFYFKFTKRKYGEGRRLLKCAPIHHHFELSGWKETQVITRFWIISGLCAGLGLAILSI